MERNKFLWGYKIFLFIIGFIILGIISYPYFNEKLSEWNTTPPLMVMELTKGEIIISPRTMVSVKEALGSLEILEESINYDEQRAEYSFETPIIDSYGSSYYGSGYDRCDGKKIKINFSSLVHKSFSFNYVDKTFTYTVPLYKEIYYFSDDLKNQDCYLGSGKHPGGYLKDEYNNNFIKAVTRDLLTLQENGYSENEIVEIATLLVQSVRYGTDHTELNRYPYETFYEEEGNCLDKSIILSKILENLNYTSYIITGESEGEGHAIVGINCEEGNIEYDGKNLCFIETTVFSPIGEDSNIEIKDYLLVFEGPNVYKDVHYGAGLSNKIKEQISQVEAMESQFYEMGPQLLSIKERMCKTDCLFCEYDASGAYLANSRYQLVYCNDYVIYNHQVHEYNQIIDSYNELVKDWYTPYLEIENLMFNNQYLIKREESK